MNHVKLSAQLGEHSISFETGKIAKQADGAVIVSVGDTMVLCTVVAEHTVGEGKDFFPLTVDYREKAAAVGRFPGGYFRREGRPSEKEILTSRMIDRPLRPLFPKGFFCETQVIAMVLSADGQNDPDTLSIVGASAALMVSDIPWAGPIGAVRVGRVDGQFVANPTHRQMEYSDLDLVYVGSETNVIMIEGAGKQLPDDVLCAAMDFAQEQIQSLIKVQKDLAQAVNRTKRQAKLMLVKQELLDEAYQIAGSRIESAIYAPTKLERHNSVAALKNEVREGILAKYPESTNFEISQAFDYMEKKAFRKSILELGKRCDGRTLDELRPLSAETGLIPRSHGTALFARGETQALCYATLAAADEAQEIDAYTGGQESKRFILHYNFPPYSTGEVGRFGGGGQNRREVGHGALAERSIEPVIPPLDQFNYAIRITSEVMESNGSTSMASVCGGVLALMDAGVPIANPVAGISIGLVTEQTENGEIQTYKLLTDILGSEDHYGDMDFKLSGSRQGFTGFQLDLKLAGIPLAILKEAIQRSIQARHQILDFMDQVIASPRATLSPYAPRIETVKISPDKIGLLIGPGGKTIKGISAETGVEINIDDSGMVSLYSNNPEGMERAKEIIQGMTGDIEVGKMYRGRVVSIKDFGVFVEVFPGRDGLVHISELADVRVNKAEDVVRVGDECWVKCIGVDDKGRVKLSRKAAMKERATAMNA